MKKILCILIILILVLLSAPKIGAGEKQKLEEKYESPLIFTFCRVVIMVEDILVVNPSSPYVHGRITPYLNAVEKVK